MSQERNEASASHDYEYVYHWDRIAATIALLVLVTWGVCWWLAGDNESGSGDTDTAKSVASASGASVAMAVTKPVIASTTPSAVKVPDSVVTEPVQLSDRTDTKAGISAGTAAPVPQPDKLPASAATSAPASMASAEVATAPGKLLQGEVRVTSSRVTGASLDQVIDQDLVPIPKGVIEVGQRKAVRVVFSVDIAAPGEPVTYHWFHEGKQTVSVKTRISPEGKSVGSKYISFDTPGDWQVQLVDAAGKVMAEAALKARRK